MARYEPEIRLVSRESATSCPTLVNVRISMPRARDVMDDVVEYAMNKSMKRFYLPHSARATEKGVGLKGLYNALHSVLSFEKMFRLHSGCLVLMLQMTSRSASSVVRRYGNIYEIFSMCSQ